MLYLLDMWLLEILILSIPANLIVSSIVLGIIWVFLLYLLGKYVILPLFKAIIRGFLDLNPLGQVFLMALVLQLSF